jgi:hypothetical protein
MQTFVAFVEKARHCPCRPLTTAGKSAGENETINADYRAVNFHLAGSGTSGGPDI